MMFKWTLYTRPTVPTPGSGNYNGTSYINELNLPAAPDKLVGEMSHCIITTPNNGHLPRYLQVHVESRRPSSRHEEGKRMAAVPSAQSHDVDTTALATGLTRPASNSAGPATQGTVALNLPRWENLASARGLHWCKWPYHMITTFLQIFLMRRNCQ